MSDLVNREDVLRVIETESGKWFLSGRALLALGHVSDAVAALPSDSGVQAEELRAKLDDMRLHEALPDPHDQGYMNAWHEMDEWLKDLEPSPEAVAGQELVADRQADAGGDQDGPESERSATSPRPVATTPASPSPGVEAGDRTCPDCNGTGRIQYGGGVLHQCSTCGGSGTVPEAEGEPIHGFDEVTPEEDEGEWVWSEPVADSAEPGEHAKHFHKALTDLRGGIYDHLGNRIGDVPTDFPPLLSASVPEDPSDELVERVARALYLAAPDSESGSGPGDWRKEARAVIPVVRAAYEAELKTACDEYGLPASLDALLRHLKNNHAATLGFNAITIETLEAQRDEERAAREKAEAERDEVIFHKDQFRAVAEREIARLEAAVDAAKETTAGGPKVGLPGPLAKDEPDGEGR